MNAYKPYKPEGVGLRLEGYPTDVEKFYWIVAQEGCHPKAAKRILDRIILNGYDLLSVMSRLNFDWIVSSLAEVGVVVTFIDVLPGWTQKYKDGEWPQEALPERFRDLKRVY
jgi:hypothetical protein